jgi:ribosome-binding protein aMBF1 (putative translation factor)
MLKCELCGKVVASFQVLVRDDDEDLLVCPSCQGREEVKADMEYERQREEGTNEYNAM